MNSSPNIASLSRWNEPLRDQEIKTFFDTYMPWASATAYAVRKQTLMSSVGRGASSMVRAYEMNAGGPISAGTTGTTQRNEE